MLSGLAVFLVLTGCRHAPAPAIEGDGPEALSLSSSSLQDDHFPASLTCDGANTSPDLHWNAPPSGTRSLALILNDPDAPGGGFVHWIVFDLPSDARALPASCSRERELPDGTRQGINNFGAIGYGGPCPDGTHHYVFTLFALDTKLSLSPGSTRTQLNDAMLGHILARGTLIASYRR